MSVIYIVNVSAVEGLVSVCYIVNVSAVEGLVSVCYIHSECVCS